MTSLFWPGDERAGRFVTEAALLGAMVAAESAWLAALVECGIAPASAADSLNGLVTPEDVPSIAAAAEGGGTAVLPLVALLRERVGLRTPDAARWLHRGLTSQDVLDTALVLCLRDAAAATMFELDAQIVILALLADRHRNSAMVGRTLGQYAVPITFGAKAAVWLQGVLDAAADLDRVTAALPAQFGGAAGTRSALVDLIGTASTAAPHNVTAHDVTAHASAALRLADAPAWHTTRAPLTRLADALTGCTDAWGHIANDVVTLSRPEIGELAEPAAAGRGGSSTMPQKVNPVLSVLIRRAALAAPASSALLHLAAAQAHDERPAGAWHVEAQTLQLLARHTLTAATQTTEVLAGLVVDTARMRARLDGQPEVHAERQAMRELTGADDVDATAEPTTEPDTDPLIDAVLARASAWRTESR